MEVSKELLSPCGLYCGFCAIYIADRDDNAKFKERLTGVYGLPVEDLHCKGCMSEEVFGYCHACPIRDCVQQKGHEGCYECGGFPCKFIDESPLPAGKKVISRAVPRWREIGTERWVAEETERHHCPECGEPLFRGASRCRNCKAEVDVD